MFSSKLPIALESLGGHAENTPVLSHSGVRGWGIYPPTPHLLLVGGCSQGHQLSSISGSLSFQVKYVPVTRKSPRAELQVVALSYLQNMEWVPRDTGVAPMASPGLAQCLAPRVCWEALMANLKKQPSSTHCSGAQSGMGSMGKPHFIDMASSKQWAMRSGGGLSTFEGAGRCSFLPQSWTEWLRKAARF